MASKQGSQKQGKLSLDSRVRKVNAIIAAVLSFFFFLHATLGIAHEQFGMSDALAFLAWFGVAAVVGHVALCIATSRYMLSDQVRPPSEKKKKHLALKWASGGVLLALVGVHLAAGGASGAGGSIILLLATVALLIALAAHIYIGMKSLTRDLDMSKRARAPLRVVCVCVAVAVGLFLVLSSLV